MKSRRPYKATNPELLTVRLWELLRIPGPRGVDGIQLLVDAYLEGPPQRTFAGRLFDELPQNAENQYTLGDIAASSLLDVRFSPRATHALIVEGRCNKSLAKVPASQPLWKLNDEQLGFLRLAYNDLKTLPDVGATKASKLLARKRPDAAPITDSVVERVLDTSGWSHLEALHQCLRSDAQLVRRLRDLSRSRVSPLRALDIVVWMLGSESTSAQLARGEILGSKSSFVKQQRPD